MLFDETTLRKLDRLALVASQVRAGVMKGERRSTKRGTSIEFADYRDYVRGDDLRRALVSRRTFPPQQRHQREEQRREQRAHHEREGAAAESAAPEVRSSWFVCGCGCIHGCFLALESCQGNCTVEQP